MSSSAIDQPWVHSGALAEGRLPLPAKLLEAIRQYETCTIADAIEHCGARFRNEGFTRPGLRCLTAGSPRSPGYAATYRVRSSDQPIIGGCYPGRPDCVVQTRALEDSSQ